MIALNSLKLFATDRMALFFFILFPFMFVILFTFLLGGATQHDERMELHLVTQETSGGLSRMIIDYLQTKDESELKPGEPRFVWDKDYYKALQEVEQNVAAIEKGPLPADILARLDEIAAMVPFRPFEEPFGLPFARAYKGPGVAR